MSYEGLVLQSISPKNDIMEKTTDEESVYEFIPDNNKNDVRIQILNEGDKKKPKARRVLSCCMTVGKHTYSFCHCAILVAFVLFVLFIAIPLLICLIGGGVFFLAVMESAKTVLPEILNRTMIVIAERSNSSSFWTSPERWNITEFKEIINSPEFWNVTEIEKELNSSSLWTETF